VWTKAAVKTLNIKFKKKKEEEEDEGKNFKSTLNKQHIKGVARRSVVKVVKVMGIKGLPEQLKHYHRDSRVEQYRGALSVKKRDFFLQRF